MATLGAARNVSPLIRFGRYTALITGFFYGSWHYRSLAKKEERIQEQEKKLKAIRHEKVKAEKERLYNMEMNDLGRECGIVKA